MRRSEKEIRDRRVIDDLIHNAKVCRLAMCDEDIPYVVPVCFGYDGERIYVHSSREGKKLEVIRRNRQVCFEMEGETSIKKAETACKWSIEYTSVIGHGAALIVDDAEGKRRGLDKIMEHYGGKGPFQYSERALDNCVIIEIAINDLTCKGS